MLGSGWSITARTPKPATRCTTFYNIFPTIVARCGVVRTNILFLFSCCELYISFLSHSRHANCAALLVARYRHCVWDGCVMFVVVAHECARVWYDDALVVSNYESKWWYNYHRGLRTAAPCRWIFALRKSEEPSARLSCFGGGVQCCRRAVKWKQKGKGGKLIQWVINLMFSFWMVILTAINGTFDVGHLEWFKYKPTKRVVYFSVSNALKKLQTFILQWWYSTLEYQVFLSLKDFAVKGRNFLRKYLAYHITAICQMLWSANSH